MLWRYMDLAKFVSRAEQFEDPVEGRHTDADRTLGTSQQEAMFFVMPSRSRSKRHNEHSATWSDAGRSLWREETLPGNSRLGSAGFPRNLFQPPLAGWVLVQSCLQRVIADIMKRRRVQVDEGASLKWADEQVPKELGSTLRCELLLIPVSVGLHAEGFEIKGLIVVLHVNGLVHSPIPWCIGH